MAYTFAGIIGGGIAPFMFATLQKAYGSTHVLSVYLAVALLITAVALMIARERAGAALE